MYNVSNSTRISLFYDRNKKIRKLRVLPKELFTHSNFWYMHYPYHVEIASSCLIYYFCIDAVSVHLVFTNDFLLSNPTRKS